MRGIGRFLSALPLVTLLVSNLWAAPKFKTGTVLVVFAKAQSSSEVLSDHLRKAAPTEFNNKKPTVKSLFDNSIAIVSVSKGREKRIASLLSRNGKRHGIQSAELDYIQAPAFIPNDPYFSQQWQHTKIQSSAAWDITKGDPSVIIAILDTGVDATHPDLASHLVPGWNLYDNTADTSDTNGHGTATAGAAGAIMNNGIGVAGICGNCGIMPLKISDPQGYGFFSTMVSALDFALNHGARVANLSFSGAGASTVVAAAQRFQAAGGVFTWAAGNAGTQLSVAQDPSVLYVGATDSADNIASFSNFGDFVTVSAPGVSVELPARGGSYGSGTGTSFSAPIVAGTAALVLSANPSLSGAAARQIVIDSADDLGAPGKDIYYGFGRVNAAKAVTLAKSYQSDTAPPNVALTSPADGAQISGSISITASASDNDAIASVSFYLDGLLIGTDTTSPYAVSLNTTSYSKGSHAISAIAKDASSNTASASISVSISSEIDASAPSATITSPSTGQRVSKSVKVTGVYSDNIAVTKVDLYVDGLKTASSSTAPFTVTWNASKVKPGTHTLQTKAFDATGNSGLSQLVSVQK